ncbi:MAG: response regulator [bacterium]|nr:response regulator [bacterium]
MTPKRKILVVEDETALLNVLVEWLKIEGYEGIGVATGHEAAAVARKNLPDLILLDIILPGKNGFEVMKELSEDPKTASIPVVILTNLGDQQERRTAMSLGAKGYLVKAENDFVSIKKMIGQALHAV